MIPHIQLQHPCDIFSTIPVNDSPLLKTTAYHTVGCNGSVHLIILPSILQNNFCATHSAPPSSCSLAPSSSSAWKDISPRGKKREHPLTSKTLLKPPKNKKVVGIHSPTRSKLSISPQVLKDTQSYSMLGTCAHCNTTLPLPAHQKHQVRGDTLKRKLLHA